jgi:rare lipoprotein A
MHPLQHKPIYKLTQCLGRWAGAAALLAVVSACSVVPKSASVPAPPTAASSTSSPGTAAPTSAGKSPASSATASTDSVSANTATRPDAGTQAALNGNNTAAASSDLASSVSGTQASTGWAESGVASWYGPRFHGKLTANGERFNTNELTAAHKTLPFGTRVRVRSLVDGKEVVVRINDRGPFIKGRIIDLSKAAATAIGLIGIKQVEIVRLK